MSLFMSMQERDLYCSAEESKKTYFLTAAHLAQIPSFKEGGWGNNTRLFSKEDLLAYALQVHGEAGLRKKEEARARRADKKRERESAASAFERALLEGEEEVEVEGDDEVQVLGGGAGGGGASTAVKKPRPATGSSTKKARHAEHPAAAVPAPAPAPAAAAAAAALPAAPSAADKAAAARLLAEARRALKGKLTWDYLHSKNSQHGCLATIALERVEQRLYACMIGRGRDPGLRSLVKAGAWYTAHVPLEDVVGEDGLLCGSGGPHGSNREIRLGGEDNPTVTIKYCPATSTCTFTGFVDPRGF